VTDQLRRGTLGFVRNASAEQRRLALFALGFRPFFLLAAGYAVAPMVVWLLEYRLGLALTTRWGGMFFHGHEMVFGFTSAAIAGFLLTAVPNWTGAAALRGARLVALVLLWSAGRIAMFSSAHISALLVAVLDLAFYPALIVALTPPLLRAGRRRNFFVPVALSMFFVANACAHLGIVRSDSELTRFGLHFGAYLAVALILIIGNRVVPMFTINALRRTGFDDTQVGPARRLHPSVIALAIAALGSDLASAPAWLVGALSATAGVAIAWRLAGWHGLQARRLPLVWVLHIGYGFIAVGLVFLAAARFLDLLPWSAAFHLLTSGAIGIMVLGMMSRVALGHTGRPLRAPRVMVAAYALVIVGALIRSFAPAIGPTVTQAGVVSGGILWLFGYLLYILVYAPMLTRPRADGRPG